MREIMALLNDIWVAETADACTLQTPSQSGVLTLGIKGRGSFPWAKSPAQMLPVEQEATVTISIARQVKTRQQIFSNT